MSKADIIFIDMCRDILENGYTTEGQKVRPVWEDGTPAYTIKSSGLSIAMICRKSFNTDTAAHS